MWSHCTCIAGLLRLRSLMRIKNRILTAGVRTPPGARSFGSFLRHGSGICVSNWGMRCITHPCAQRNLLPPSRRSLLSPLCPLGRRSLPSPSCMDLRNSHALRSRKDLPEQISVFYQMEPCVVRQAVPCMRHLRRLERNGSLRVLYAARIGHGRSCPLREQCQESATTIKARRVSTVCWPVSSSSSFSGESSPASEESSPIPAPHAVRL